MEKIILLFSHLFFIVVYSYAGENHKFIQGSVNKLKLIKSAELRYTYRIKPLFKEDTASVTENLRFLRIDNEGYSRYAVILTRETNNWSDISFYNLSNTLTFSGYAKKAFFKNGERNDMISDYYRPFFDLPPLYSTDTSSNTIFYDSSDIASNLKVFFHHDRYEITPGTFEGSTTKYVFSKKDSVPIYFLSIAETLGGIQYQEYQLLNYKLSCYDSIAFFKMMNDSIASLSKKYPEQVDLDSLKEYYENHPKERKAIKEGAFGSDFRFPSFAGDTIDLQLSLEKNKLVLLDFWYNSCMPCQQAIPKLVALYKKYHIRGLEILGLNPFDTNKLSIQKTIDRHGIIYPILSANSSIVSQYGIHGYPTLFLLDKNKKVIFSQEGFSDSLEEELEAILEKQLQ
jgi:thiol-disulfide isomerase/thioredoxin